MSFLGRIVRKLSVARPITEAWPIAWPNSLKAPCVAAGEEPFYSKALYSMGRSLLAAYMHLMLDVDIQLHTPLP